MAISALMVATKGIEMSALLSRTAEVLSSSTRRPGLILVILAALTGPLIMNDTAVLVFVPMAISMARLCEYPPEVMVVYVTIASNVGSALTPFGNPQNMIIYAHYGLSTPIFASTMFPFVAFGISLLILFTLRLPARKIERPPPLRLDQRLALLSLIALAGSILLIELGEPLIALVLSLALVAAARPGTLLAVDYAVIGILGLMLLDFRILAHLIPHTNPGNGLQGVLLAAALSQGISNVPATSFFLGMSWKSLALGVNLGGVWFISGSLANILAVRLSGVSLRDFHKYQLPYAVVFTPIVILLQFSLAC